MTKWTITITTETDLLKEILKVLNFMNKLGLKYLVRSDTVEAKPEAKRREGGLV